jgi:hypothetical protein
MRYWIIGAIAVSLCGCASDVTMLNPRTGEKEVCTDAFKGFNPWSQTDACVANHEAQGWIVADPDAGRASAKD